jgi:hypothetical protein
VNKVNAVLDELSKYIDEIPPIAQPMRYGNKAYRTWHARVFSLLFSPSPLLLLLPLLSLTLPSLTILVPL